MPVKAAEAWRHADGDRAFGARNSFSRFKTGRRNRNIGLVFQALQVSPSSGIALPVCSCSSTHHPMVIDDACNSALYMLARHRSYARSMAQVT